MRELLRCATGALALWLHDYREPLRCFASFLVLSAAFGVACWLYQALCFVVAS